MDLRKQRNRNNLVNKRCARRVYDSLKQWRTGFPQAFDQVIDTVRREAGEVRGSSACLRQMIALESTAKLGLFAGVNGKDSWKISFPDWLDRRWKCVCRKALQVGIAYGKSKTAGYVPMS